MRNNKTSDNCCDSLSQLINPDFFKAFCDPNRISMFSWLCQCCEPKKVKDIAQCCQVDLSVVSRHLALMKQAGVLHAEKCGKEVYYSVNSKLLAQSLRDLATAIEQLCKTNRKEKKHGNKK